jgi:lipopolysaccharide export system permease protein
VDKERGVWTHVLVHDDRDPRAPLLVLAREGTVSPSGRGASLAVALRSGEVHRAEHSGTDYTVLRFQEGDLNVGVEDSILRKNHFRSPKEELTPSELLAAAREARSEGKTPRGFLTAFHVRMAEGFTPLAFALFGVPLAMASRAARTRAYLLTLLAYVAYYVVERAFENWGAEGKLRFLPAGPEPLFKHRAGRLSQADPAGRGGLSAPTGHPDRCGGLSLAATRSLVAARSTCHEGTPPPRFSCAPSRLDLPLAVVTPGSEHW